MQSNRQILGQYGENLAAEFLRKRGFEILDRNIKESYKELDIVALRDNEIVFVEVKTRARFAYGDASDAMSRKKSSNLRRAVAMYLNDCKRKYYSVRIDLVAIDINRKEKTAKVRWYKDVV